MAPPSVIELRGPRHLVEPYRLPGISSLPASHPSSLWVGLMGRGLSGKIVLDYIARSHDSLRVITLFLSSSLSALGGISSVTAYAWLARKRL